MPKLRLADGELSPDAAYQLVHDELLLDGQARLNLATFVTTWMEPQARTIIDECLDKNMIDKDEYPQTAELERRCVNILASLWGGEDDAGATGCSTTGSSEACMLGGLALKWRWRQRRRAAGLPAEPRHGRQRPGVLGEVLPLLGRRAAPGARHGGRAAPHRGRRRRRRPVRRAHDRGGRDPGVHVRRLLRADRRDLGGARPAAGRQRPGRPHPRRRRLGRVRRAVPGPRARVGLPPPARPVDQRVRPHVRPRLPRRRLGRVARRGGAAEGPHLPGRLPRRPDADVRPELLAGRRAGRGAVRQPRPARSRGLPAGAAGLPRLLSGEIAALGPYRLISHGDELPVFAFTLHDGDAGFSVYDVSEALRSRGWIVPAYPMPPGIEDLSVLRACVRNGFSRDLASLLLDDLVAATERLQRGPAAAAAAGEARASFHH